MSLLVRKAFGVLCVVGLACLVGCGSKTDLLTTPLGAGSDAGAGGDSGEGPTSGCAALEACCQMLPAAAQSGCAMFIQAGDAAQCDEALSEVQQVGYCGGIATGSGSGSSPPANAACVTLAACCGDLESSTQVTECEGIVAEGNAATCASADATLEGAGLCGVRVGSGPGTGEGPECAMLASCCTALPPGDQPQCESVVSEGNQAVCDADLMAFHNAGLCGGTGSTPPQSPCLELGSCCASPELTTEEATACEETASSGDQLACGQEIGMYCVN